MQSCCLPSFLRGIDAGEQKRVVYRDRPKVRKGLKVTTQISTLRCCWAVGPVVPSYTTRFKQRGIISPHSINWFVFITETVCVYSAVRTESLTDIQVNLAMVQAVSWRTLIAEVQVRSQIIQCEICGGQSGSGTGFSPTNVVFPCQYHSINATYTSSSTYCCKQMDKRTKPGNLPTKLPTFF